MNYEELEPYVVTGKPFTAAAVNVAAKAGEWVKSQLGQRHEIRIKSNPHDLVTEVDQGAERLIRKLLKTYFPTHTIFGEEEVGSDDPESRIRAIAGEEYVWIVDPIDGTSNFIQGFPFYSVSIALAHRGEVIVGVVYDPSRDELFVAEKGKGAYVHGQKMSVSQDASLKTSLLATGFPPDRERAHPMVLRQLQELLPKVRNIRTLGSAALMLAYVAAGRLSGFWEPSLKAWDVAAGVLLVQEAGGRVSAMDGGAYDLQVSDIVATNGRIHDELLDALK